MKKLLTPRLLSLPMTEARLVNGWPISFSGLSSLISLRCLFLLYLLKRWLAWDEHELMKNKNMFTELCFEIIHRNSVYYWNICILFFANILGGISLNTLLFTSHKIFQILSLPLSHTTQLADKYSKSNCMYTWIDFQVTVYWMKQMDTRMDGIHM